MGGLSFVHILIFAVIAVLLLGGGRFSSMWVRAAPSTFARSSGLLFASSHLGYVVRRQTERPPLNIIVQPHFIPYALTFTSG